MRQYKEATHIVSCDFNVHLSKSHPRQGQKNYDPYRNNWLEKLELSRLKTYPEEDLSPPVTFSNGATKSTIDFTLINGEALSHIAIYKILARPESDHFPQTILLRQACKRLPTSNITIADPRTKNVKKLKWQGQGIEKEMEAVHCDAGSLEELKNDFENQEDTVLCPGARVKAWKHLCDSLLHKSPNKSSSLSSAVVVKEKQKVATKEQPWYNRAMRNLKKQVSRKSKKVSKETRKNKTPDNSMLLNLRLLYKKACWKEKRQYYEGKFLMSNKMKNNSKCWQLVNELVYGKQWHSNAGIDAASWEAHVLALYSTPAHMEIPGDLSPTNWSTSRPPDFSFKIRTKADPD
ncbi:hypothetical protein NDU88_005567 [Pleurodeles waltl]|uniref:Endonuclease/exonuclease/phosphatase domain-containing protein n=1 Tax=Pleurodeles waltl TaxID=8319 RepID=A0AAV7RMK0_PLEWA|nr:hypothetical protein NDU88_005567 [Pleurodeles waltl]